MLKKIFSPPESATLPISTISSSLILIIFFSLSIFLPTVIHQQAITGSIVNALLFLTTAIFGTSSAMLLGLIPSTIALSSGLLPLVLAPIVPFIILSNTLLVLVFSKFSQDRFGLAVILASLVKFIFLFITSQYLLVRLLPNQFLSTASQMFSWPQLITALAGGVMAQIFFKNIFYKN